MSLKEKFTGIQSLSLGGYKQGVPGSFITKVPQTLTPSLSQEIEQQLAPEQWSTTMSTF